MPTTYKHYPLLIPIKKIIKTIQMEYINIDKVVGASIIEPNKNTGEQGDFSRDNGWQVLISLGFLNDGQENLIFVDKESRQDCINLIKSLRLTNIK